MTAEPFDSTKAEAFTERIFGILNDAGLAQMMVVGHQAGIFDTMAKLPPSTSEEIASAAGLNERYVREWLGAMVTGLVIEYEPEAKTYRLPPEHGASTTRAAGPDNMLLLMQIAITLS